MANLQYFDIREEIKRHPDTFLFQVIGRRGVGKTTSVLLRALDRYVEDRKRLLYVRRWSTELRPNLLNLVYAGVEEIFQEHYLELFHEANILTPNETKWFITARGGTFRLNAVDKDDKVRIVDEIGTAIAVSLAQHSKGGDFSQKYDTILFDEIVSDTGYIPVGRGGQTEVDLFAKIIASVGRSKNTTLKVFTTANPDYDINSCPYLYPYHINYDTMKPLTPYMYDGAYGTNKAVKDNVAIIKVAKIEGDESTYILPEALALFGSAEERMSETGEMKTIKFARITRDIRDSAIDTVYCEMVIECPVIRSGIYHAKIYAYPAIIYGEPCILVMGHHWEKATRLQMGVLYCRYDAEDIKYIPNCRQTFRLNIPPLEEFAELRKHLQAVGANKFVFADTDENGTLYQVIAENSK